MSNKVKYKARFLDEWLENSDFKDWIWRHQKDPTCAFCKYCHKTFSVAGQGVKQLYSQMNSDKYKERPPVDETDKSQNKQKQMTVNFIPVDKLGDVSESTSTSSLSKMNTLKQSSINTVLQRENVTRAEVIWVLEILMNNYSYRSCVGKDQLFTPMIPDSSIAQKFQLCKTKASYVICYGLAPF